jgi:hypothetical protein
MKGKNIFAQTAPTDKNRIKKLYTKRRPCNVKLSCTLKGGGSGRWGKVWFSIQYPCIFYHSPAVFSFFPYVLLSARFS